MVSIHIISQIREISISSIFRVEFILYSSVSLYRQSSSQTFLRTIETSRTKSRRFFATHVKALSISHDISDSRTVKIISACRGITSLTLWVVPVSRHAHPQSYDPSFDYQLHYQHYHVQPYVLADLQHHSHSLVRPRLSPPASDLSKALTPLRPRRLSITLNDILGSPNPQFHLPFFSRITHLSIINKWEDWVTWKELENLPCLTHLSLDLSLGESRTPLSTSYYINEGEYGGTRRRTTRVANALRDILTLCECVRVLVLLLLFDSDPAATSNCITREIMDGWKGGTLTSKRAHVDRRCFDSRLVFARDSQPFRDREAHSIIEGDMWKSAEEMVYRQKFALGAFGYPSDYIYSLIFVASTASHCIRPHCP